LICIVEDDEAVRVATKTVLRFGGYEVRTFSCADDLLNSESLDTTECLILGVRMPGTGGLELQRRLRSEGCRVPIIFITAQGDDLLRPHATEYDAVATLGKPIEAAALLKAIEIARRERHSSSHVSRKTLRQLAADLLSGDGYVPMPSALPPRESRHFRECAECVDALANIVRGIVGDREKKKKAANESG
jgi:FixJ family two-component response regulator